MNPYLYFDNASTTKCCASATAILQRYSHEAFGNPSSTHRLGQVAGKAIREARLFFANYFRIEPEQVIFTGSGTEANNLALYGIALSAKLHSRSSGRFQIFISSIEHPSVKKSAESLKDFGIEIREIPVDLSGQPVVNKEHFTSNHETLISIHQVNNIVGSLVDVENIAKQFKRLNPRILFHTDAVQSFGKFPVPQSPSSVDLVSLSGHKIGGPKGVGALILLNKDLLRQSRLRPLIWGGEQENGFRSGTQNAGLIAGFHFAAIEAIEKQKETLAHVTTLNHKLREILLSRGLLSPDPFKGQIRWNSPIHSSPFIVSLGIPGIPSGPLVKLLEERNCLVSVGSACSSKKPEPEPVLKAMGFPQALQTSSIRISFSQSNSIIEIEQLIAALEDSIQHINKLRN